MATEDDRHIRVTAHMGGPEDPLMRALAFLIWNAHQNGVRTPGDRVTMLAPSLMAGPSEEEATEIGSYEITIKKMEDE
jgi:hypothetical protein